MILHLKMTTTMMKKKTKDLNAEMICFSSIWIFPSSTFYAFCPIGEKQNKFSNNADNLRSKTGIYSGNLRSVAKVTAQALLPSFSLHHAFYHILTFDRTYLSWISSYAVCFLFLRGCQVLPRVLVLMKNQNMDDKRQWERTGDFAKISLFADTFPDSSIYALDFNKNTTEENN